MDNSRGECSTVSLRYDERASVALTERLLREIQRSVVSFRPSKSLSMLSGLMEDQARCRDAPVAEIDLVISGGGMKGYFMTGCASILVHELQKRNVHIRRISGAR